MLEKKEAVGKEVEKKLQRILTKGNLSDSENAVAYGLD